ncbi:hypothetical protein RchiOBHm_Chr7g0238531 [Rosa chinensis]|uniref:Uncharacterized protein n=1 Tax=Rosa chinensis TaxID=74649 RepID=A0A2P6PHG5_ROSCH|nr:hypothetical protein RchiOBHm_Chr7g0238531 [Rosa chinensis]
MDRKLSESTFHSKWSQVIAGSFLHSLVCVHSGWLDFLHFNSSMEAIVGLL